MALTLCCVWLLSLQIATAQFRFASPTSVSTGLYTYWVDSGDFDHNGQIDLVEPNYWSASIGIQFGHSDGTFTYKELNTGANPIYVKVVDLNHDGNDDIVVSNWGSNTVSVFIGDCHGNFTEPHAPYSVGALPSGITVADFDGKNGPDIAVGCYVDHHTVGPVCVLLNNGDGTFTQGPQTPAGITPYLLVAGDFNHDHKQDIAVSNYQGYSLGIYFGNGDGTFTFHNSYPMPFEAGDIQIADMDGDHIDDILISSLSTSQVFVFKGNCEGDFTAVTPATTGFRPTKIVIADFDHDGVPDVVTSNDGASSISLLHGNGDGTLTPIGDMYVGFGCIGAVAGDFNHDGILDLFVTGWASGGYLLFGTSKPNLSFALTPPANANGWNNQDVSVSIVGSDNLGGAGVGTVRYSVDGGPSIDVPGHSASIGTISTEGDHPVSGTLLNLFGGIEVTSPGNVRIDKTAPTTTVQTSYVGSNLRVTLTATDNLSGVDITKYILDDGAEQTYSGPFDVSISGRHHLLYWSVDKAGNTETMGDTYVTPGAATYTTVRSVSGEVGQHVTLAARLRATVGKTGIAGQTLVFLVDGVAIGNGTTNAKGVATLPYVLPEKIGTMSLSATFAGDSTYAPSVDTAGSITVRQAVTNILVIDRAGAVGQRGNLVAHLRRSNDSGVASRSLRFSVNGAYVGDAVTNDSGVATLSFDGLTPVGTLAITVEFAGDAFYTPSTGTGSIVVSKADTAQAVPNRTVHVGKSVILKSRLHRTSDGAYLEGETITFTIDGVVVGTAVTDSTGLAQLTYAIPTGSPTGTRTIGTSYDGSSLYNGSTGSGVLTVNP